MARRRGRQRDDNSISNELDSLLQPPTTMPALAPLAPFSLPLLEDNRTFHPEGPDRDPLSFFGTTEVDVYEQARPARRVARTRSAYSRSYARTTQDRSRLPAEIGFRYPDRVAVCVRRKRRKEVLHALRKTGRGGGGRRRYNRNSQVRC